jgi:hypothetical protein
MGAFVKYDRAIEAGEVKDLKKNLTLRRFIEIDNDKKAVYHNTYHIRDFLPSTNILKREIAKTLCKMFARDILGDVKYKYNRIQMKKINKAAEYIDTQMRKGVVEKYLGQAGVSDYVQLVIDCIQDRFERIGLGNLASEYTYHELFPAYLKERYGTKRQPEASDYVHVVKKK